MNAAAFSTAADVVPPAPGASHPDPGLPLLAIVGLVLLAVPRIVARDLHLVPPSSLSSTLLAVVPLAIWVTVAIAWSRRPLASLITTGLGYGIALAVVHNLTWGVAFDEAPRFGGNLTGVFAPLTEEVLMRGATTLSSLVVGVLTGLVCGALAWVLRSAVARRAGA